MSTEIAIRVSPEEKELASKREELALLQAELAERELFLTNLRAELLAFEGQYLRQVGTLYAELDDWNAQIAERLAEQQGTEEARSAAAQARTQAEESNGSVLEGAAKAEGFKASPELRSLFLKVAKRVHCIEAAAWFRRAAEQGDMNAQRSLGYMYAKGEGVPQNDAEALIWLRKAAEQGDLYSQRALDDMLR